MLTIDLDSPVPMTQQIVAELRCLIASNELGPGDELPPVRQLAADLGINLNTVARAYRELEASGLVSTIRGRGTRITAANEPRMARNQQHLSGRLRHLLADAKLAGLSRERTRKLVSEVLREFWPAEAV